MSVCLRVYVWIFVLQTPACSSLFHRYSLTGTSLDLKWRLWMKHELRTHVSLFFSLPLKRSSPQLTDMYQQKHQPPPHSQLTVMFSTLKQSKSGYGIHQIQDCLLQSKSRSTARTTWAAFLYLTMYFLVKDVTFVNADVKLEASCLFRVSWRPY